MRQIIWVIWWARAVSHVGGKLNLRVATRMTRAYQFSAYYPHSRLAWYALACNEKELGTTAGKNQLDETFADELMTKLDFEHLPLWADGLQKLYNLHADAQYGSDLRSRAALYIRALHGRVEIMLHKEVELGYSTALLCDPNNAEGATRNNNGPGTRNSQDSIGDTTGRTVLLSWHRLRGIGAPAFCVKAATKITAILANVERFAHVAVLKQQENIHRANNLIWGMCGLEGARALLMGRASIQGDVAVLQGRAGSTRIWDDSTAKDITAAFEEEGRDWQETLQDICQDIEVPSGPPRTRTPDGQTMPLVAAGSTTGSSGSTRENPPQDTG